MKGKFLFLFLLLSSICFGQQKKNVLFIMVDDFNHWIKDIGYYTQSITPNIDKFAREGVLFANAQCSSPVCNPSRNALWSGLRPSTTGISTNSGGYIREVEGLENTVTMNQYFTENGYYTFGVGKLYHPGKMGDIHTDPTNWSEISEQPTGSNGGNLYYWSSADGGLWQWGAGDFNEETNANDRVLARKVASLIKNYKYDEHNGKPFFIGAGLFRPHLPWKVHKKWFEMFDPDTLSIPKGYIENDLDDIYGASEQSHFKEIVDAGMWKEAIRAYLACMSFADENVGIILDALRNSEYKDNTIVCLMGDHGWHLGEKMRFSKYAVYEQANHTTLIIYDPSKKGNGQICQKVVSLQDLYPTLIALTGSPANSLIEGNDLSPLLDNPNLESWNKPVIMKYNNVNYIKSNKWKYIIDGEKSQFYDIVNDPYEWTNLINDSKYDDIRAHLQTQLDSIIAIGSEIKKIYKSKPRIKITNINDNQEFDEGVDLDIETTATVYEGTINYLTLYLNDNKIADIESAPFNWEAKYFSKLRNLSTGKYLIKIIGYNINGVKDSSEINISVKSLTVPKPFKTLDIGNPKLKSSSYYDNGTFNISTATTNVSGYSDQFHYIYQPISGNFSICVKIESQNGAVSDAKAGLMIREELTDVSRQASIFIGKNGTQFQNRNIKSYRTETVNSNDSLNAPCWLKLERNSDRIIGYKSLNNLVWEKVSEISLPLKDSLFAGMVAVSGDKESYTNVKFSNFDLSFVAAVNNLGNLPNQFELKQNYPNPFNPETNIVFNIRERGFVKLSIFNLLGSEIKTLVAEELNSGNYKIIWDGRNNKSNKVPSGIYFYKLTLNGNKKNISETKKMVLAK